MNKLWHIKLTEKALDALPSYADYNIAHVVVAKTAHEARAIATGTAADEKRHLGESVWLNTDLAHVSKLGDATGVYRELGDPMIVCTEDRSHG